MEKGNTQPAMTGVLRNTRTRPNGFSRGCKEFFPPDQYSRDCNPRDGLVVPADRNSVMNLAHGSAAVGLIRAKSVAGFVAAKHRQHFKHLRMVLCARKTCVS